MLILFFVFFQKSEYNTLYILQSSTWKICLHGNKEHVFTPEAAGRNHKNVYVLAKKCLVHKICKLIFMSEIWRKKNLLLHRKSLFWSISFLKLPCSQNSAVSLPTWLFKWSDFSIKRRRPSMLKFLRFVLSFLFMYYSLWLNQYLISRCNKWLFSPRMSSFPSC